MTKKSVYALALIGVLTSLGCTKDDGAQEGGGGETLMVAIPQAEWASLKDVELRCAAEKKIAEESLSEKLDLEFRRGQTSCMEDLLKYKEGVHAEVSKEMNKTFDDMRQRLSSYHYSFAVVSGRCRAKMLNNEIYSYVLTNACLSLVHKLVGNDGQVAAIVDATSLEASSEGIASLECRVGDAHISLRQSRCSSSDFGVRAMKRDPGVK